MEFRDLRVFCLSAKFLSFSKVADCLFMTQPSVSKYIASLEKELNNPLFERSTNSMKLTPFGEQFLPYARRILQAEDEARTFTKSQSGQCQKFLYLGIAESIGALPFTDFVLALQRCIAALREHNPSIQILIRACHDSEILSSLKRSVLDMALFPQLEALAPCSMDNGIISTKVMQTRSYLIYAPQLGHFETLEALLSTIQFCSCLHDPISDGILHILSNVYQCSVVTRYHEYWPGLLIDVSQGRSAGVISDAMLDTATKAGLSVLPLETDVFRANIFLSYGNVSQNSSYCEQFAEMFHSVLTVDEKEPETMSWPRP